MTELDYRALKIIAEHPDISSQALTNRLGLRRACGLEFTAQSAGRIGALRGKRLVNFGYATLRLVHDGYCYGYRITAKGRKELGKSSA